MDCYSKKKGRDIAVLAPSVLVEDLQSGTSTKLTGSLVYSARSPTTTVTMPPSWSHKSAMLSPLVSAMRRVVPPMTSEWSWLETLLNAASPI